MSRVKTKQKKSTKNNYQDSDSTIWIVLATLFLVVGAFVVIATNKMNINIEENNKTFESSMVVQEKLEAIEDSTIKVTSITSGNLMEQLYYKEKAFVFLENDMILGKFASISSEKWDENFGFYHLADSEFYIKEVYNIPTDHNFALFSNGQLVKSVYVTRDTSVLEIEALISE